MRTPIGLVLAFALGGCVSAVETGRPDFRVYCAGCHGLDGRGGAAGAGVARAPADLTTIAARNGGVYPARAVIATIDGFDRRVHGELVMPEFGPLLEEGRLVRFDAGDGRRIPTPERLVGLARYIGSLQR